MKREHDARSNTLRFCTIEGKTVTLPGWWRKMKVEKIMQELKRENVKSASHLVVDGERVPEGSTLEGISDGVEVLVITKTVFAKGAKPTQAATVKGLDNHILKEMKDTKEVRKISDFVTWLTSDDICSALDDVLCEKEGPVEDLVDFEALLDDQYPIQECKITAIMNMGFSEGATKRALWLNGMDVERSLNFLLETQPAEVPLGRAEYKKINKIHQSTPDSPSFSQHMGTAINFLTELRRTSISSVIEQALDVSGCTPPVLREAFSQLHQHPHAIYDYFKHTQLSRFFNHLQDYHKNLV
eukprot:TRINITY_DN37478_c0_g1_i1.p1 TRINITY_DN37478_c0_g1~~TRINITY_DN37478_c0_g1_i1.p1  ORF type:complete len:299 (+),score=51.59 TRINITY_DN37478_c0_g1_i1:37-933(+)